jgi:sulfite exporter TauE/SafE
VTEAVARFAEGTVRVTLDPAVIGFDTVAGLVEDLDYRVVGSFDDQEEKDGEGAGPKFELWKTIWIALALYELYVLLDRFGLLDVFYAFPEARAGMGYGMIFTVGLLTSVHCVAMCGGINLSQSISRAAPAERLVRLAAFRSGLLYNLGRLVSYTLIGGIAGALGSAVSLSESARGGVQIAAGAFMIIMGLNMLNVFPWLRRLNPRMPKIFGDKLHGQGGSRAPLYVGLLNGLMPCGPLQAMQIYALSTGSFLKGALSMFFFSAGTIPLMFGLSALSGLLSRRFTRSAMTVGAVMVVLLGAGMFGNGMDLSGLSFVLAPAGEAVSGTSARMEGGVQVVRTELQSGRYAPIVVRLGTPVRWNIHAEPGTVNGCNNRIVLPGSLREAPDVPGRIQKKLAVGDNLVEFVPTRAGTFTYTCWMGMIRGKITVVDETETSGSTALAAESTEEDLDLSALSFDVSSEDADIFSALFSDPEDASAEEIENASSPSCCAANTADNAASAPSVGRSCCAPASPQVSAPRIILSDGLPPGPWRIRAQPRQSCCTR